MTEALIKTELDGKLYIPDDLSDVHYGADVTEEELDRRFEHSRISNMTKEFLERGIGFNAMERLDGRQFVVAYIDANGPYADIPLSVEVPVFSKWFEMPKTEVVQDYGKYDRKSVFAAVIDASIDDPMPAGVLRIIHHDPSLGFKDVNDLLADITSDPEVKPNNPWIDEIKSEYFLPGEDYSPELAWQRLSEREGVKLDLAETFDVATHASAEEYAGVHGDINGVSMLFYHACLRYAMAKQAKNLVAIFDIPPFENLQQFGSPFDTYRDLGRHPYGGPYDTVPAFCVLEKGMQRIRDNDPEVGRVFIDGAILGLNALMPDEYDPDNYSNEVVGLEKV
jgi:hypothetical protein